MKLRIANLILLVVLIATQGWLCWKDQGLIREQQKTINLSLQTTEFWKSRAMACEGLVMKNEGSTPE